MTNPFYLAATVIVPMVFAIVLHEIAHGWAARLLGDPTAYERGRLSLNPLKHVDPMGTLILPGMLKLLGLPVFGWAKPVPVSYARLRNPKRDMALVAAAGPLTNFTLAALSAMAFGLLLRGVDPQGTPGWGRYSSQTISRTSLRSMCFSARSICCRCRRSMARGSCGASRPMPACGCSTGSNRWAFRCS